jgi:general secretion pathway protein G
MRRAKGFTIVELLVVLAALGLLLSLAAPRYVEHVDRSREVVLKHNLKAVREAIDRYHADRGRHPSSLQELVRERYLREVPLDPVTDRADTWLLVAPQGSAAAGSVMDLKSGAHGNARDGTAYATW